MGRKTLVLLVSLFSSAAFAATPSSPFTAVNSDGRPMTGATVTVTDELGMPAMNLWADPAGTVPYSKVVPSTGIVQFFGEPKTYVVTVSGSGTTRQFYVDLSGGGIVGGGGGLTEGDFGPGDGLLWKRAPGAFDMVKINFGSVIDPTPGYDINAGYTIGSFWINAINGKAFQCVNDTPNAAVWKEISNEVGGGGGSEIIDSGTALFQVPFWTGTKWGPSSALWTNGTAVGIGPQSVTTGRGNLQISKNTASPNIFMWNTQSNVVSGTEFGEIGFGASDSSPAPRTSAKIVARSIGTWGPNTNLAPSSLDFRVQSGTDIDTLVYNALRVTGHTAVGGSAGKVIAGPAIPDGVTVLAPTWLSTMGIDIFDGIGSRAISLLTPLGLANNLTWTLPNTNGTSGYALITDGASPNASLSWGAVTPGLHAANHAQGGIDEVASYQKIWDEGTLLTQRRELVFTGAGVTCSDSGSKTSCSIAGGAGGGITTLAGDTSATQTFSIGTTGTDFNIVNNLTGDHKFNIPDASFTARGFMTTGGQAFNGTKVFQGLIAEGTAIFNNTGGTINFQVKSDTNNNAIFVDAANDSVGIMTNTPAFLGLSPSSLAVAGITGKHGITTVASSGKNGLVAYSGGAGSVAVIGVASGVGDTGVFGSSTDGGSYSGQFQRSAIGSVPIVKIQQLSTSDTQPLLDLVAGSGQYQMTGHSTAAAGSPDWGITTGGRFMSGWIGAEVEPIISSLYAPGTGFYIDNDNFPGLSTDGDSGLHLETLAGFGPKVVLSTSKFIVDSFGLPTINSYLADFAHSGTGNGLIIRNETGGTGSFGLRVNGANVGAQEIGTAVAGRFDVSIGTAVDARQTGSFTGTGSTAPVIKATRETVLSGGAALAGPVIMGVDNSATSGRLIDLQRPANVSKFFVSNEGMTTIDGSITGLPAVNVALTVKGPTSTASRTSLFTAPVGTAIDARQTGSSAFVSTEPVLRVGRETVFTGGGASYGAMILGVDDNGAPGVGLLFDLQKPAGTSMFSVSPTGATIINNGLGGASAVGLTVQGATNANTAKAAVFTTSVGNTVDIRQTGTTPLSAIDPALKVVKNTVFTGGALSSGELILGIDDTGGSGLGELLDLQQPAGVSVFLVDHVGELSFKGVAADGTGKALCVKANGYIGTCSTVVSASGVCTCV